MSKPDGFSIFNVTEPTTATALLKKALDLLSQLEAKDGAKKSAIVEGFEVAVTFFTQTTGPKFFLDVFNQKTKHCDIAAVKNSKGELESVINSQISA